MLLNNKILITGFSGFVGSRLLSVLSTRVLVLLGRKKPENVSLPFYQSEFNADSDYSSALAGVDVVIHSAARVHMMNEQTTDPLAAFRDVNTFGTVNLARQAAAAGVKRFIFISSIKVNGESTRNDKPFRHDDKPLPDDAYGISKAEAEIGLKQIAVQTGMEVVIIRPPLVYGLGVKANFAAMMKLARKNLPLPLGAIHNKRSLVALDNLVDLIVTCIEHPKAANQTFLVSDEHDVSTTELLQMMTRAAGKKPRLLPVPMSWLKLAGKLTGKSAVIDRLCGNLQVDISHTKDTLGWRPPVTVEEGIARCFAAKG
ncbi:SDR family oxidoreductase [Rheinheimera sp.]|uniref:UDP-glucose 4-epimerase family protein n=1 Tax=Rheinheimera sp. TaxID=1869214 RepID=UPI002734EE9A|nr:SDR family oxidoreductase [Rheinheimera sp.]MDP2715683.1 SDR family oxidoreductase [Rheinheimera sp.]